MNAYLAPVIYSELTGNDLQAQGELSAQFALANVTREDLELRIVGRTCPCVAVTSDDAEWPDGEVRTLNANASLRLRISAPITKASRVRREGLRLEAQSASRTDLVALDVELPVFLDMECMPRVVNMVLDDATHQRVSASVAVRRRNRNDLQSPVLKVGACAEWLRIGEIVAEARGVEIADGVYESRWRLDMEVDAARCAKHFGGNASCSLCIGMHTARSIGDVALVDCALPVSVSCAFGIDVPERVASGGADVGAQAERLIRLRANDGRAFSIVGVECMPREFRAAVPTPRASQHHGIAVSYCPEIAGQHAGTAIIRTDKPGFERLEVPLVGVAFSR